jgi:hypothetical protein
MIFKLEFLYRIREDGSGLQKVVENPVIYLYAVSPDGKPDLAMIWPDFRSNRFTWISL